MPRWHGKSKLLLGLQNLAKGRARVYRFATGVLRSTGVLKQGKTVSGRTVLKILNGLITGSARAQLQIKFEREVPLLGNAYREPANIRCRVRCLIGR